MTIIIIIIIIENEGKNVTPAVDCKSVGPTAG